MIFAFPALPVACWLYTYGCFILSTNITFHGSLFVVKEFLRYLTLKPYLLYLVNVIASAVTH